ncbi:MAG: type II toxin-antitoxin system Phd/YefM family antitoxin [Thermomicrobiales bacterium]
MPKTISTTEAKNQLSAMIGWAEENRDEVIVESHGRPRAAIVSYEAYEEMVELKERFRRQDALARLRQLDVESSMRNQELAEGEADELALRFSRAFWMEMAGDREETAILTDR